MIEIAKNEREVVRVERSQYKGHNLVNVRVYFQTNDGEWFPTKKGIAINESLLPTLIDALQSV